MTGEKVTAGILVSNHTGRQIEGAVASLNALKSIIIHGESGEFALILTCVRG